MKRNQCILILLFALSILSIESFSQYDFRKGFVVTNSLDTIQGLIDYTHPEARSKVCAFKKDDKSQITFYNPKKIHSYYVSNSTFLSKPLNISDTLDHYFVEYLVDGIVNLYFLQFDGKYYYFIEKENEIYNLSNELVEVNIDGSIKYKNSNQYMGILNWLLSDVPLREEIYNTKFDHNSLINITKSYHNLVCNDQECIVYYKRKRKLLDTKWQINIGFSLGLIHSNVFLSTKFDTGEKIERFGNLYDQYNLISTNKDLNSSATNIIPGLFLQLDRNTKYMFSTGLFFEKLSYSAFDFTLIQFPFLIDYELLRYKNVIPYLSFGTGFDFNVNLKTKETKYVIEYAEMPHGVKTIDLEPDFINNSVLPNASLGFGIKNLQKKGGNLSLRVLFTYSFKNSNPIYNTGPHEGTRFNLFSSKISLSYSFPVYVFMP